MTSRLTLVRATAAAAIVLAPVALTACGSKDDDAAAASSTVATSTTTTTTTTKTSEAPTTEATSEAPAEETTEAPAPEDKPAEGDMVTPPAEPAPAPEQAPAPAPAPAPIDPNNLPPVQPLEGGQPASQADIDAVIGVMQQVNSQKTIHGVIRAAFNNTCSQALGPNAEAQLNQELATIPDVAVDMMPGYAPTTIQSLTNAKVDGDSLSGDLTVNNGGQVQTSTIRMHRENGQWKICDS